MNKMHYWGVVVALAMGVSLAQADVRLPKVFSDHMVLQRDISAPVWGWADPGETITVKVADQTVTATADPAGKWRVKLSPIKAGGPYELVVTGKTNNTVVTDVLVGDVWICAGQSNMEFGMGSADNAGAAIAAATNQQIRLLNVKPPQAIAPAADIPSGWAVCSPQAVGGFSAVGYFFGATIQKETGVPIGLIGNAWGGTLIEPWTNPEGLSSVPELAPVRQDFENKVAEYEAQLAKAVDPVGQWVEQARAAKAKGERIPAPPAVWPAHPASAHTVWTSIYNSRVAPLVPFGIKGAIWYQGESNGGEGDSYYQKMRALIGGWRQVWGQGDFPFYYVQLANWQAANEVPAGGDGWANVRMAQDKSLKIPHTGMAVTIDIGDAADIHPKNKEDVGNRLAFWALKQDYGQTNRVCSGPLYKGMKVEEDKIRVSFDYADSGLIVGKKTGHGPAVENADGKLQRFAIAGEDKKWFWADAVIEGSTVLVSCPAVPAPVAVRYAFSMNPAGCNLYNAEGLPCSPFRTDRW
jgi:sialate O-acetylesterase